PKGLNESPAPDALRKQIRSLRFRIVREGLGASRLPFGSASALRGLDPPGALPILAFTGATRIHRRRRRGSVTSSPCDIRSAPKSNHFSRRGAEDVRRVRHTSTPMTTNRPTQISNPHQMPLSGPGGHPIPAPLAPSSDLGFAARRRAPAFPTVTGGRSSNELPGASGRFKIAVIREGCRIQRYGEELA